MLIKRLDNEKVLRVEIRVKNKRLYDAIYEKYGSINNFSKIINKNPRLISAWINIQYDAYSFNEETGDFKLKKLPQLLCDHFFLEEDFLFPRKLSQIVKNKQVKEISFSDIPALQVASIPFDDYTQKGIEEKELEGAIESVLGSIPEKERKIIKMIFGLDGSDPMSVEEVADNLHRTRQTIYLYKLRALRRLRHPTRKRKLEQFIEVAK